MTTSVRAWFWKDPVIVQRDNKNYRKRRDLTDIEVDFINDNYYVLINMQIQNNFFSDTITTIKMLGIAIDDWWYVGDMFIFTHEVDRNLVQFVIR
jgi:hypothetical protein